MAKQPRLIYRDLNNSRIRVKILFEDPEVIVVEKPAGLLTISTDTEKRLTAYAQLYDHVKSKIKPEKLFIVHRLDREASGLLVFAKSESAKFSLQQQFRERLAGRTYLAVTERRIARDHFTIRTYLAENSIHRCYSTPDPTRGKLAITHVKVLKRSAERSRVEVNLETGRKHQIRIHLAEAGHPIVGDQAYGSPTNPIHRLALHAVRLAFKHPRTGEAMEFHSQPPASFANLV